MRYKTATTAETAATTLRNGRSADRKLPCHAMPWVTGGAVAVGEATMTMTATAAQI